MAKEACIDLFGFLSLKRERLICFPICVFQCVHENKILLSCHVSFMRAILERHDASRESGGRSFYTPTHKHTHIWGGG